MSLGLHRPYPRPSHVPARRRRRRPGPDPRDILPPPGRRAAEAAPADAAKPAPAKSIIHIFLPGGMAHQDSWDPKPLAPIEYRGELGDDPDQARRRGLQRAAQEHGPGRGQDHRLPVDDARRGRPRARHAQHVHRLPAQPGPPVPQLRQRRVARIRAAQQPAAVCLRAEPAEHLRRPRLPVVGLLAVQPRRRPGRRQLPRAGPDPARRRGRQAVHRPPHHARRGQRAFRLQGKGRRPGGDGHLLPAGL